MYNYFFIQNIEIAASCIENILMAIKCVDMFHIQK